MDHHGSNPGFADLSWIDGDAPATAVVVYRLLEAMGGPVSRDEAICLYTALSTDTGNFLYASTNAESFCIMSALMEAGLPLAGGRAAEGSPFGLRLNGALCAIAERQDDVVRMRTWLGQ